MVFPRGGSNNNNNNNDYRNFVNGDHKVYSKHPWRNEYTRLINQESIPGFISQ